DRFGLKCMFYVPIAIQLVQLALTLWLEREAKQNPLPIPVATNAPSHLRPAAHARTFLRMAWLANPFSYIASNTVIAVMPGIAQRLGLSTTQAGFCASVWCFMRLAAFWGLWF